MIVAIIQARQTSSRFKNKIFSKINNLTILEWIILRLKNSKKLNKIVFAIPKNKKNKRLKNFLQKKNCLYYSGSENNVLSRFKNICKKYKPTLVVRICADNPFICPIEIDRLIEFFKKNKADYAYNHIPKKNYYPDGIGAEITNIKTLKKIFSRAKSKDEKEHIFNYVLNNEKKFKIKTINPKNVYLRKPFLRLDIDYKEQLNLLKNININPSMKIESIIKKIIKN